MTGGRGRGATLRHLAVLAVGALHATAPARAADEAPAPDDEKNAVSVSLTDDFEIRYWLSEQRLFDPDDVPVFNYVEQVNRLNAVVSKGPWAFDAQWDEVALFATRYRLDGTLYDERVLTLPEVNNPLPDQWVAYTNLEKVRGKYETKGVSISLGDSYAAFGRGIALNLNRNVDIDIDTSIQGAKVVWRPGAWDVTAVAGQLNRQQVFQDNPNIELQGDYRHTVAGLRAERFGLGPFDLGAHGVVYDFTPEPGLQAGFDELGEGGPDVVIGGVTAAAYGVAGIDWYLEGDAFGYDREFPATLVADPEDPGYAAYLSGSFYPGSFVVLVEGKRYYQAQRVNGVLTPELYQVAVAPTLEYERQITEDSAAALNSNDIWGSRITVDWAAKPGELTPYVAVGLFRDLELGGLHFNEVPETIVHPLVGVEWLKGESSAIVNAGYRIDDRDGDAFGADRHLHGDAAIRWPLPLGLAGEVNAGAEWYRWGVNPFQQEPYVEMETGWTVHKGSDVGVTWYMDYTTNPLIDSTGNLSDPLYGALELQVKPTSAVTVKLFGGAYKAGIRCSGGQCRTLPGFEGGRFSITGTL